MYGVPQEKKWIELFSLSELQGEEGLGITSAEIVGDNLHITLSDGTILDVGTAVGKTPVKGIDYLTEPEIDLLKQEVTQHVEANAQFIKYITASTIPPLGTPGILYIDTEQ